MIVRIKRQEKQDSGPYWQSFSYKGVSGETVAAVLNNLNYPEELTDTEGNHARRIRWECSCMQTICGACAMIINGKPALACDTFVDAKEDGVLTLEPLSKFPVVSDLIVDRSCIQDYLKKAEIYLGNFKKSDSKEYAHQYSVAKCLKCGLCLEVCPNFVGGGDFFGAIAANEIYLMMSQSEDRKKQLKGAYKKHFAKGCSKSLACQNVCPMHLETLSSIGNLNRIIW